MDLTSQLNPAQKEAATYLDGHLRIVAGAGSGKTRVLTYRIAYLIDEIGVDPRSILAITFTNKAANEMRLRVEKILGSSHSGVLVCTIHSLCVRILRQHIRVLNYPASFVIMDEEDQRALLKLLYKQEEVDAKAISYHSALNYISVRKNSQISPEMALEEAGSLYGERKKALLYQAYVAYQEEHYMLDFDDLIIKTNQILAEHEDIRQYWQRRFQYIHVDEFQDVDAQNYTLVKWLTSPETIVCVVGDPDQTIYSFRGANVRFILDFEKDFEGAKTIYLNQNYRSTGNILQAANALIKNNQDRLEKDLYTRQKEGAKVIHYSADSDVLEAKYVVEKIEQLISTVPDINYRDFAVLYRANYLSRTLEQELIRMQIPYRLFGGLKFFSRKEIKDALSYLRLTVFQDDLAFERVVNTPGRGIGEKTLEKIRQQARVLGLSMYDTCLLHLSSIGLSNKAARAIEQWQFAIENAKRQAGDMLDLFDRLLGDVGYLEMLRIDQEETRLENLMELKNSMASFMARNEEGSLEDYLQEVALYTNQDVDDDEQYVSLMTIHMSKGLEFPYVFVIGLSENIFPSLRSMEVGSQAGLEEERRLAYVAFTRAQKQLFLVESRGYSYVSGGPKIASRFIDELGEDVIVHEGKTNRYKAIDYLPPVSKGKQLNLNDTPTDWKVGDLLVHDVFGKGVVLAVSGELLQIAFPLPYGIKMLQANHKALKKK